jgi:nucleotide-binding universal stress UspA family protein
MYQTILVPLDGSDLAERALPYAETLARASGARLLLLRAVQVPAVPGRDPLQTQTRAVQAAERYLAAVAARLAGRGILETAVFYGDAAQAILEEAALRKADLIVMATHGRSGLGQLLYGSVAKAVLARSPVPVLLVRAWHEATALSRDAPRRFLVPLDGSSFAEAALPVAHDLVASIGGELLLFQALPPPSQYVGEALAAPLTELAAPVAEARALAYLHQVRARWVERYGGAPPAVVVRAGPPAEAIDAACQEFGVALVVMATHGRTGLARLLLGSVADELLRRGRVPLLLVRPGELCGTVPPAAPS